MAVRSIFDQWQKDVFFSAAEEVQESADTLESIYRMWIRYRSEEFESEISDELLRELRTALGTAKWQLEEFERAANLNHEKYPEEENKITRHREFISAIGNQISHIETALNDSLIGEGNQPLRWVQLNEEERDDLAIFLSAAPQNSQERKDKYANRDTTPQNPLEMKKKYARTKPGSARGFKETVTINKDSKYFVEVGAEEPFKSKVEVIPQDDGRRGTSSSPDIGAWKIVIANGEDSDRKMAETRPVTRSRASSLCSFLRSVESTAKSRLFRNSFPKAKSGEHLQLSQGLSNYLDLKGITRFAQGINPLHERSRSCFNSCNEDTKVSTVQQLVGRAGGLQRHIQGSQYYMQFGRSLRITIFLLLTIILIVPFVFYAT